MLKINRGSLALFPTALLAVVCMKPLAADPPTSSLQNLGRGAAIVFSPDLAAPSNCRFYERLGFNCYQTPSWKAVIDDIRCHNASASPADVISIVILETHGTNGNGLKLQTSSAADAQRSYAAVGALKEQLENARVHVCILSACNSGRLLRPEIYDRLDPASDRLFLPATLGILSGNADSKSNGEEVIFLARAQSRLESLSMMNTRQLSVATRKVLRLTSEKAFSFVISDLLIQLLTSDPSLDLQVAKPTTHLSRDTPEDAIADRLFARFVMFLDASAKGVLEAIPMQEMLSQR